MASLPLYMALDMAPWRREGGRGREGGGEGGRGEEEGGGREGGR